MANLQIKGIDEKLYADIKMIAAKENRSLSQQVLFLIREYLSKRHFLQTLPTPAQTLLEIAGSWEDDREADEVIAEIKRARKNSKKLMQGL